MRASQSAARATVSTAAITLPLDPRCAPLEHLQATLGLGCLAHHPGLGLQDQVQRLLRGLLDASRFRRRRRRGRPPFVRPAPRAEPEPRRAAAPPRRPGARSPTPGVARAPRAADPSRCPAGPARRRSAPRRSWLEPVLGRVQGRTLLLFEPLDRVSEHLADRRSGPRRPSRAGDPRPRVIPRRARTARASCRPRTANGPTRIGRPESVSCRSAPPPVGTLAWAGARSSPKAPPAPRAAAAALRGPRASSRLRCCR